MKKHTLFAIAILLAWSTSVSAKLWDRGGGLIYDDVQNITWLQDANYAFTTGYAGDAGHMSWASAMNWAANLEYYDSVRNVTWTDWRLPDTHGDIGNQNGFYASGSEMGHLYYNESIMGSAFFINIEHYHYWYRNDYAPPPQIAWSFDFLDGSQGAYDKNSAHCAWAVMDGDVGVVATTTTITTSSTTSIAASTTTTTQSVVTYGRPVPDTGQTTSYATGDDGYYSINLPSYTKLGINDVELPDTGTADMGWVSTRDNVTGLTWLVEIYQSTFYNLQTVVDAANKAKAGGHNDWRVPSVRELQSIVSYDVYNPVINMTFFPNTDAYSFYWSSSPTAYNASKAWNINFGNGFIGGDLKSHSYDVRLVRGGQQIGLLSVNGDGTVTDVSSGLMWQQGETPAMAWKEALSQCLGFTLGDYDDWRLPTVKELISIVDFGQWNLAIDQTVFSDAEPFWYWSSTASAQNNAEVWGVGFDIGNVFYSGGDNHSYYTRCVRNGPINESQNALVIVSPPQAATANSGTLPITWTDPQNIGGQVAISLSRDGGKTWETITDSTENDGTYDWTVTGSESVNCVLKVEPIGTPDKVGYKGLFSIAATQAPTTTTTTTTSTTSSTTENTTTTTTLPVVDQPNSTIRIYPVDGDVQDYYTISDTIKLKANYRDQEGFDVDVTGVATWTSTNGLIADVGNGVSKGGTVTFKGNGEVRIFSFLNGLMDYMDFRVGSADIAKHHGNLIILAGGKSNDAKDSLKEAIQYLCNRIYQVFKVRMFKDEDIYYINQKTDQDFNGDGIPDGIVDQTTKSLQTLSQAIQWAKAQPNDGPLYLYLVDHGEKNGTFLIDSNQVLTAPQLGSLLDDFESTGRTTVVILEACYSGSFLSSLAGTHRVILTSANADKYSFIGAGGRVSFDQFFSNHLMVGKSWEDAFDLAVEDMQSLGVPYSAMMPQKSIGAQVTMGKVYGDFTMASLFPEMKTYTPGDSVEAETPQDFTVQLDVTSNQDVEVWGMVTPPNYQPPTVTEEYTSPVVNLDKIVLTPSESNKDFTGQYTFPCAGAYTVTYYAKDSNGMVIASPPQTFGVTGDACGFVAKISSSWNLLSLPRMPADSTVGAVLGPIKDHLTSAWKWENETWSVYLPTLSQSSFTNYINSKGFSALTAIDVGQGFWLNSETEQNLNITGTIPVDTSLSLTKGWNLLGLKGDTPQAVTDFVSGNGSQIASIWKWEGGTWSVNLPGENDGGKGYADSKGFGHLSTITPGEGFWVNKP